MALEFHIQVVPSLSGNLKVLALIFPSRGFRDCRGSIFCVFLMGHWFVFFSGTLWFVWFDV